VDVSDLDLFADPGTAAVIAGHHSVLHEPAPLVVRPASGAEVDPSVAATIRELPTVTVLIAEPDAVAPWLADAFDVCLAEGPADPPPPFVAAPVEPVRAAVATHPEAALALVALLRDPRSTTAAGLAAESAVYALLLGSADFHRWLAERGPRPLRPAAEPVLVRDDDGVRTITLNRPEVRNAVDRPMRDALVAALQGAAMDRSIRRVVLRGAGPAFSAGGDLAEFGTVVDPATAHAVRLTIHPGAWVDRCADRTWALLHGPCIGAGIEVPAFAGRVVATTDATFALPELRYGLIPGAGGTVSVPRRIGRARTAWLALTGAVLDATTAGRWGLVDEVVDELPADASMAR
jgi:enoyl-CoA hydratase/carnithine racemase